MKIERLIGILSVLLQKDMVTAADLADMFEVSGGRSKGILKICAGQEFP